MQEEQLVVYRLGTEHYALPIAKVKEIIIYNEATKLPNTPSFITGVINLRGKVIPVVDLGGRFGVGGGSRSRGRVLVIETGNQEVGLLVDEVTEVIRLSQEQIDPAPGLAGGKSYIQGIGKKDNELLILLNPDELLAEHELAVLQTSCLR